MQDLKGNLNVFEPISVLQMINLSQASGELRLIGEDNSARVYFESGRVRFAGITNRPLKLGELLLKEKRVRKNDLDRILEKKRKGKKLGALLIEAGVITESDVRSAVEEQIKQVIYEIVRWREGLFTFSSGSKPRAEEEILIDIPLDHLILEGLKRLDEERQPT
jgi:hypothetical protein